MEIYIVIHQDRHFGVEAVPYAERDTAVAAARSALADYARYPEDGERPLNEPLVEEGWVFYATYGPEGDCIWVVKRELLGEVEEQKAVAQHHTEVLHRQRAEIEQLEKDLAAKIQLLQITETREIGLEDKLAAIRKEAGQFYLCGSANDARVAERILGEKPQWP